MAEKRPNRVHGPSHDEFWARCASGELWMQRCAACQLVQWPPVESECEKCASTDVAWEQLSGRGDIVSWCTFERSYYPELPVPWDTIVVELEEGPLFISNPAGFSGADVTMGMGVQVAFVDCEDGAGAFRLPVFERA
jgi:uncharacterized OB-fold protein